MRGSLRYFCRLHAFRRLWASRRPHGPGRLRASRPDGACARERASNGGRGTARARSLTAALLVGLAACDSAPGPEQELRIPPGASFSQVVDTLTARGVVGRPGLFSLYARMRGADRSIRAGRYRFSAGDRWGTVLDALTEGRIVPVSVTFVEGWTVREVAARIADFTGADRQEVDDLLREPDLVARVDSSAVSLEGYLFPDTYLFAEGTPPRAVVEAMLERFRAFWTAERRARLDSLDMSRHEVVTLASIVQAEAGNQEEMPTIAGVYANRLEEGWLLQADPTVLYALGGPRDRLLFAAIDSVADSPYNTYRQPGLPPGPISAPGEAALDAALAPADVPYMFFVAGPDGGHVFSTTHAEHNRAVADYRRRQAEARRSADGPGGLQR